MYYYCMHACKHMDVNHLKTISFQCAKAKKWEKKLYFATQAIESPRPENDLNEWTQLTASGRLGKSQLKIEFFSCVVRWWWWFHHHNFSDIYFSRFFFLVLNFSCTRHFNISSPFGILTTHTQHDTNQKGTLTSTAQMKTIIHLVQLLIIYRNQTTEKLWLPFFLANFSRFSKAATKLYRGKKMLCTN